MKPVKKPKYEGFTQGFRKAVNSSWFHKMHEALKGPRTANSKLGIVGLAKRRGIK